MRVGKGESCQVLQFCPSRTEVNRLKTRRKNPEFFTAGILFLFGFLSLGLLSLFEIRKGKEKKLWNHLKPNELEEGGYKIRKGTL